MKNEKEKTESLSIPSFNTHNLLSGTVQVCCIPRTELLETNFGKQFTHTHRYIPCNEIHPDNNPFDLNGAIAVLATLRCNFHEHIFGNGNLYPIFSLAQN